MHKSLCLYLRRGEETSQLEGTVQSLENVLCSQKQKVSEGQQRPPRFELIDAPIQVDLNVREIWRKAKENRKSQSRIWKLQKRELPLQTQATLKH